MRRRSRLPGSSSRLRTATAQTVNGDLLLALLHYDAGQYETTEQHLSKALAAARADTYQGAVLERLLGYNAIFGLGDFERGRRIMESVLRGFEARGMQQEAGYVRNTIAYTLFCTRRFDDAVEMEKTALKLLEGSDRPGGFLYSVLQLNLGRLYRTLGFHGQALRLFRAGLEAPDAEQSPYMLLIFHTTLAQLYAARGEYERAFVAFQHCLGLARDLELRTPATPSSTRSRARSASCSRSVRRAATKSSSTFTSTSPRPAAAQAGRARRSLPCGDEGLLGVPRRGRVAGRRGVRRRGRSDG